jgi:hypothetical protein
MHNRQPITPKLLWKSMLDYDLWPLYIIGVMFQIPATTPTQYLTLSLKGLGFNTFRTNLLVIPSTVLHTINMMALTYAAEIFGELTITAGFAQVWMLPFLVYIYQVDITKINKWKAFGVMSLLLSYPSGTSPPQPVHLLSLTAPQHTRSKSPGPPATPMPCARAPSRPRYTTCLYKPAASSPRISTAAMMPRATSAVIAYSS